MRTKEEFSKRRLCQYSILFDLLSKHGFEKYLSYVCSYEKYVRKWIRDQIERHLSDSSKVSEFEDRHIQSSIKSISDAIKKSKMQKSDDVKKFVEDICKELGGKLVISQDAFGAFMILNNADQEQFAKWLTESVKEMGQALREKFNESHILIKLYHLHVKPQNELFSTLIGCGRQCPFCKSPCEAGGGAHSEHFASIHRTEGLGRSRWDGTKKLVTDICSSLVISDTGFCNIATNHTLHPYYWKYVMAKFNNDFAKAYDAEPADIPSSWYRILHKEAEESLRKSFFIK
uniref:VLIG-type G domain-containing protein n=1 Tax=Monopterus albus TaxID=43700 RepID=A0A3Q3IHJ0_MONAL